jgi:hypothetical protein
MGIDPKGPGMGNITWLSINQKESRMYAKFPGATERQPISGFEGDLDAVSLEHKPANEQYNISAHDVFRLKFTDVDSETGQVEDYALDLRTDSTLAAGMINSLLGLHAKKTFIKGEKVYFRVYEKNGKCRMFIANGANSEQPMEWKYPYANGGFVGVPAPKELDELDKDGNVQWDYSEVNAFWKYHFLQDLYPAVNGAEYVTPRQPEKVNSLYQAGLKRFRDKESTIKRLPSAIDKWLKNELKNPEDRKMFYQMLTEYFVNVLGGDKAQLDQVVRKHDPASQEESAGNKVEKSEEKKTEEVGDDDLPF